MFSGMNLGSSARQISYHDDVEFEGLRACYVPGEDIKCQYRHLGSNVAPSNDDWVGLYKVGWKSLREYLGFHWINAASNDNADNRTLTFPATTLPKAVDNDEYQLCYISQGTIVRGKSRSFKISTNVPANVTESESMLFVDLQQSSHSPMANQTPSQVINPNANVSQSFNHPAPLGPLPPVNRIQSSTTSSFVAQAVPHTTSTTNNMPPLSQVSSDKPNPSPNPTIPQQSNLINSNLHQSNYDGMRQPSPNTTSSPIANNKTNFIQADKLVSSTSTNDSNSSSAIITLDKKSSSATFHSKSANACNDKLDDPEVRRLFDSHVQTNTSSPKTTTTADYGQNNISTNNAHVDQNHQQLHHLLNAKLQLIWPLINYISDGCPLLLDILHQNNIQTMHSEKARHAVNVCLENLTARKREAEDFLTKVNQLSQELERKNIALEQQKQLQNENKQLQDNIVDLTRQLDSSKDQITHLKNMESDERKINHECLNAIQQHIKVLEEKIDKIQPNSLQQPPISNAQTTNTIEQSSNFPLPSSTSTANTTSSQDTGANVYSESFYAPASGGGIDIYGASNNTTTNNASNNNFSTSEFASGWQHNYDRNQPVTITSNRMAPPRRPMPPTSFPGQDMTNNINYSTQLPPLASASSPATGGQHQLNPEDYICPICKSVFPVTTGYQAFEHHVNICIDSGR